MRIRAWCGLALGAMVAAIVACGGADPRPPKYLGEMGDLAKADAVQRPQSIHIEAQDEARFTFDAAGAFAVQIKSIRPQEPAPVITLASQERKWQTQGLQLHAEPTSAQRQTYTLVIENPADQALIGSLAIGKQSAAQNPAAQSPATQSPATQSPAAQQPAERPDPPKQNARPEQRQSTPNQ